MYNLDVNYGKQFYQNIRSKTSFFHSSSKKKNLGKSSTIKRLLVKYPLTNQEFTVSNQKKSRINISTKEKSIKYFKQDSKKLVILLWWEMEVVLRKAIEKLTNSKRKYEILQNWSHKFLKWWKISQKNTKNFHDISEYAIFI